MRAALFIAGSWWCRVCIASLLATAFQVFAADAPRTHGVAAGAGSVMAGAGSVAPGAGSVVAATIATAPPSEVAGAMTAVRLQGRGTLRFFGLAVYEARLWTAADFAAAGFEAHAFALELQYARRLEGAAIAQRSIVEMRRSGSVDDGRAQVWQAAMTRAFPDVVPGDRLTGVHLPGEATRFFHNGRPTSALADPLFARLFFGIWLAVTTSEPGLRRQLIGPGS